MGKVIIFKDSFSLIAAIATIILIMIVVMYFPDGQNKTEQKQYVIIFPIQTSFEMAYEKVTEYNGIVVREGLFDFVLIAYFEHYNNLQMMMDHEDIFIFESPIYGSCYNVNRLAF